MLIGRIFGWFLALVGVFVIIEGFNVPAFVATSYLTAGALLVLAGALIAFLSRNRKKSIEKEAQRQAEIEKRKNEILKEGD